MSEPGAPAPGRSEDRRAIATQIERFIAAYVSGDLDALLEIYSDDLVKLRHGSPDETKPDLARRLQDFFRGFSGRLEVDNSETLVSGDLALTRGTFVVTVIPRGGGEPKHLRRRYLEIWRREGAIWRVLRQMDNTTF